MRLISFENLTPAAQKFVEIFIATNGDHAQAWRSSYGVDRGLTDAAARLEGIKVLRDRSIAAIVAQRSFSALSHSIIQVREVIGQWCAMVRADPREIITHRRVCCRYCWGSGHQYQFRDETEFANEFARVIDANQRKGMREALPSDAGGYGYRPSVQPHPECPKCDGEGIGEVYVADFATLSPGAALLYDGIEQTKNGIKVKLRSRDEALTNIAKWLKVLAPDQESGYLPPDEGDVIEMPESMDDALYAYRKLTNST